MYIIILESCESYNFFSNFSPKAEILVSKLVSLFIMNADLKNFHHHHQDFNFFLILKVSRISQDSKICSGETLDLGGNFEKLNS